MAIAIARLKKAYRTHAVLSFLLPFLLGGAGGVCWYDFVSELPRNLSASEQESLYKEMNRDICLWFCKTGAVCGLSCLGLYGLLFIAGKKNRE